MKIDLRPFSVKVAFVRTCLYEDRIKNMGNAGRNGGEYYTPRPLIKAVQPKIGETVYDAARQALPGFSAKPLSISGTAI